MKKYFSIGETAKINNISIQALRHYDKIGLIEPAHIDPESNYRYYTMDQFVYLDIIKYMKNIGTPLKELKDMLKSNDIKTLLGYLRGQESVVENEIRRLEYLKEALSSMTSIMGYSIVNHERKKVFFRNIKERKIIKIPMDVDFEDSDIIVKFREVDNIVLNHQLIFNGESGIIANKVDILEKELKEVSIFSSLSGDEEAFTKVGGSTIPQGEYLCIIYSGKEREEAAEIFINYINEKGIELENPIIEVQLFNNIDTSNSDEILFELQTMI